MSYLKNLGPRTDKPVTERIAPDQVLNSAGGYVFGLTPIQRMARFLILGSEGGSYYASERKLTLENVHAVSDALDADGAAALDLIVDVSVSGRAHRQGPTLYALACACSHQDLELRLAAIDAIPRVCRTGTMLFEFLGYVEQHRGWGRALRRGVAKWYEQRTADQVAFQAVKYAQREGWSQRDVLRLAHPKAPTAEHKLVYDWICGRDVEDRPGEAELPTIIKARDLAHAPDATVKDTIAAIEVGELPREAIPSEHLDNPDVLRALLPHMGITALLRNLANLTRHEVLTEQAPETKLVCERLTDGEQIQKGRVHPMSLLFGGQTYQSGHGLRGTNTWQPIPRISEALDHAFYQAFGAVTPTGKRIMLALDVSGSMTGSYISGTNVTAMVGTAAMALVTKAVEPDALTYCFSTGLKPLDIRPTMRLDDVVRLMQRQNFGGTDCALPMTYALKKDLQFDAFVVYTDSETWAGGHPVTALRTYRQKTGIDAKLIVVGMTSGGFTIADPADAGMLDVVGFDVAAPAVMSEFISGAI